MSTKLQFLVLDLQIFPPTNTIERAQTQRDNDERLLFFIQARERIMCAIFAGPLQALTVFICAALSLFLEHRVW